MKRLRDAHALALFRYVVGLTHDRMRAEDVVQETLLRAWQHPEVINDPRRSARAWLFTVARNIVVDEWRSARFRREFEVANPHANRDCAGTDETDVAVDRLLLSDALARLSRPHREVIGKSYYQRKTTAEIAAELGVAEGTVKSRLHYALRALRVVLEEMGYTGGPACRQESSSHGFISSRASRGAPPR
jgi:RNA polymerase sigma-70 factor, ECF subfamily